MIPILDGPESDWALRRELVARSRPPAGMPAGNNPIVVLRRAWVEFEMGRTVISTYHAVVGECVSRLEKAAS